jgi:hypothetical protein
VKNFNDVKFKVGENRSLYRVPSASVRNHENLPRRLVSEPAHHATR